MVDQEPVQTSDPIEPIEIPPEVWALHRGTSKKDDHNRYAYRGIYFDGTHAVVTNGSMFVAIESKIPALPLVHRFMPISPKDIKTPLMLRPEDFTPGLHVVRTVGVEANWKCKRKRVKQQVVLYEILVSEEPFVDWRKALEFMPCKAPFQRFQASLLLEFINAAGVVGTPYIDLAINPSEGGLGICYLNKKGVAAGIMPVRKD